MNYKFIPDRVYPEPISKLFNPNFVHHNNSNFKNHPASHHHHHHASKQNLEEQHKKFNNNSYEHAVKESLNSNLDPTSYDRVNTRYPFNNFSAEAPHITRTFSKSHQLDNSDNLNKVIQKQEQELNMIRNALIKAEEDKNNLQNQINNLLKVSAPVTQPETSLETNQMKRLSKSDSNLFKYSEEPKSGRNFEPEFKSNPFRKNSQPVNETQARTNLPDPRTNSPKNQNSQEMNLFKTTIKQAKLNNLKLLKSRPIIEHLTDSYKSSAIQDLKYHDLKNDLVYKDMMISRYKAQKEVYKLNLNDVKKNNEILDEKLAQEECNRLLLTHGLNLCNLRNISRKGSKITTCMKSIFRKL